MTLEILQSLWPFGSPFLPGRTIALQTWHLSSPSSSSAMEESDWREAQDQSCEHLIRVVYTTRSQKHQLNELRALTYWQCGCLDLWTRFSRPISLQNLVNVKHKFHELSSSLSVSCRSADRRIGGVPFFTFFVATKLVGGNIRGNIRHNFSLLRSCFHRTFSSSRMIFRSLASSGERLSSLSPQRWQASHKCLKANRIHITAAYGFLGGCSQVLWAIRKCVKLGQESGTCWCLLNTEPLTSQQRSEVRVILRACLNDQPRLRYLQDFQHPTFYYLPCNSWRKSTPVCKIYLFSPQAWSWAFHPQLERMELHTWIQLQKRPIHNVKS